MKGLKTYLFFGCLASLPACITGGGKTKSSWDALQNADKISCYDLPLKKEDLKIDRVHVISELGPSLLLEVTSRKGVKVLYHLPFQSLSGMNADQLQALPISQDSVFMGAGIFQQKAVFAIRTMFRSKQIIQLRDLQNNAVIHQYPLEAKDSWELVDWSIHQGTLRSLVRAMKEDEPTDDQPYLQLEVPLDPKLNAQARTETNSKLIGQAKLFIDRMNQNQILWFDRGVSEKVKDPEFHVSQWRAGKEALDLDVGGKFPIESWSFEESRLYHLLAFVKGDTLLWTNSSLEIMRLDQGHPFQKLLQLSIPISKVHVAKPFLAVHPKAEYIFLPQWLDHELTIAAYRIDQSEVEFKSYLGVFPEGSSFHSAFYHDPSRDLVMLMKTPGGFTSRYSLCELDL